MKKLMIAALAIAFGAVAQAATVNWEVEGIQVNGDWDTADGDLAAGYSVYLFDNTGATSMTTMLGLITADNGWKDALSGSLASFVAGDDGNGFANGLAVADGTFNGYMVILDAAADAATQAYVTGVYSVADNALHKMDFKVFDDESGWINATATGAGSGWQAVNVPEPTSGLLLLLGMAGLALKRKIA